MASGDKDKKRREALSLMKPICIALMQEFSPSAAKSLRCAVNKVDKEIIQEILQYLLFPIQNTLHQKSMTESKLCDACSTMDAILGKACIDNVQLFFDLFNPLIGFLSSPENPSQVCSRSEEVKAAILTSMISLFKSSADSVLKQVYSMKFLPDIGQLISLILSMAECEKSRSLQIGSLDCLMALMQTDTKYGSLSAIELGDFFAFCLPGITLATTRIISGDQKQGNGVIGKAITTWSRLVSMTMADSLVAKSQRRIAVSSSRSESAGDERLGALKTERNEQWVKTSASKLKLLLDKICHCSSHPNWRVRVSLVELMEKLLTTCNESLGECVPKILDTLIALISDEYGNVGKKASAALQAFSVAQRGSDGERTLKEILEENLHSLVTSLPRRIRMSDEAEKPVLIKLLKGYILLLDSNIESVVNSAPHLRRLSLALVQSLEMETNDLKILEQRQTLLDYEADKFCAKQPSNVWKPKRFFKHFRDETILDELLSVCQLLGKYGNVLTLVDHFLDLYNESSQYKLASILIINEIVFGAKTMTGSDESLELSDSQPTDLSLLKDVVRMLVEEFVSQDNFRLIDFYDEKATSANSGNSLASSLTILQPDQSSKLVKTVAEQNRSILLIGLFLEGIGKFAQVLQGHFKEFLIQTLYPLVESLGHENIHISSTAYLTLTQICSSCGYRSVDQLIQVNADYLLNSVSLRLRHFEHNQRTPQVLSVMLRYCSQDILPLIDHSITEILDSLDDHYAEHLVIFLPVLLELTQAIGRWYPYQPKNTKSQYSSVEFLPQTSESAIPLSVVSFVEDYIEQRKIMDSNFTDEEVMSRVGHGKRTLKDIEKDMKQLSEERKEKSVQENETEEEDDDEAKKCPRHLQVVKDILQRIKNFLSSSDARVRVQVLEIVAQSCIDLGCDERELLPEIHLLWPGFYPRFHREEKFVIIKALQTLDTMAGVSGSFVQPRVMKDVIPPLADFMENQARISSGSHSAYLHTNNFKLQLSILNICGPLTEKIALDGSRMEEVARMCLPYLSDLQPIELQKACMKAFEHFIAVAGDTMWLLLAQSFCPINLHPPSGDFCDLTSLCQAQEKNLFTRNITEIFGRFY